MLSTQQCQMLKSCRTTYLVLKRFRYKKKWAVTTRKKSPPELALENFDTYYKPVYDDHWPSIRAALLSQQKYGALLNNFSLRSDDTITDLVSEGAGDMMKVAKNVTIPAYTVKNYKDRIQKKYKNVSESQEEEDNPSSCPASDEAVTDLHTGASSLYDFMPAKRVLSEREELAQELLHQSVYTARDSKVQVIPGELPMFPEMLKMYTFDRGDVRLFPTAKPDSAKKLGYYLMDAASVLPVVALDLEPGCSVLDLCAAPGGKTLTMLQTHLPGNVTCLEKSHARIQRLREVLRLYTPRSYTEEEHVRVVQADGVQFCEMRHTKLQYDRVLVDPPCNTDRHMLKEEENNLFKSSRQRERIQLTKIQTSLLCSGIKACKPGGSIVYSTCTLSPPQNDGVIQAAVEKIWNTTSIDVVVEDLSLLAYVFKDTFTFYNKCRFGQLVLPNLTANFGPMYICKLKRLK